MAWFEAIRMFFRSIPEAGRGSDRYPDLPDRGSKKQEPKDNNSSSTSHRPDEAGEQGRESERGSK